MTKKILFVENEKGELEFLLNLSSSRGYIAEGVQNAPDAVKRLEQTSYDVVIMDASEDTPVEEKYYLSDWIKFNFPATRLISLTGQWETTRETPAWRRYYAIVSKLDFCMDFNLLYNLIEDK